MHPDCTLLPPKPHFQRGSLPAGSNPARYYPSPSRIQTKPAATGSPDYQVHRLPSLRQEVHASGANVTLCPSPFRVGSGHLRHRVVQINEGKWEDSVLSTLEERWRHFAGDGQKNTEANRTGGTQEKPAGPLIGFETRKGFSFPWCKQQGPPQRWARAGGGCMLWRMDTLVQSLELSVTVITNV